VREESSGVDSEQIDLGPGSLRQPGCFYHRLRVRFGVRRARHGGTLEAVLDHLCTLQAGEFLRAVERLADAAEFIDEAS
jgi:hypothetical protein